MTSSVRSMFGIALLVSVLPASAAPAEPEKAPISLTLKVKPDCTSDADGRLIPETPRTDIRFTMSFRVAASGVVERIELLDRPSLGDDIARLGDRFARCWQQKARYDTTGVPPAAFPVEQRMTIVWKARDAARVSTANQRTIEAYMDGFRKTDRARILSCLTDDVEWVIPGAFRVRGKDDFAKHIVDEGFVGQPEITVHRMIESDDVVVAEGSVRAPKKDGTFLDLVFCDVFDMRGGKIRRLTSYLMEAK